MTYGRSDLRLISRNPVNLVRVVIVDDHEMVRRGLQEMLHESAAVNVVAQIGDVAGCLQSVEQLSPDLVLLDVRLGNESGFEACAEILRRWPVTKVVFLSAYEQEMFLFESVRVGGSGYLLKGIGAEALARAIVEVHQGQTAWDPDIIDRLPGSNRRRGTGPGWPGATRGLSRRESEILQEMARGLHNRDIARQLFISEETVKSHVKAVLRKLGARDRAQGVVIALRDRIVS